MQRKLPSIVTVCFFLLLSVAVSGQKVTGMQVKGSLVPLDLQKSMADPGGAPLSPLRTIVLSEVGVANDLNNFVGRIVKVTKNADSTESYEFDVQILADKDTVTYILPARPQTDFLYFSKEKVGQISFMGVGVGMNEKDVYEYNSTTAIIGSIRDKQIDKTKIPERAKCQDATNCEYFYIGNASVQVCSTMLLQLRDKNLKIKNIPAPAALVSLEAGYFVGSRNEQKSTRNLTFCILFKIPQ